MSGYRGSPVVFSHTSNKKFLIDTMSIICLSSSYLKLPYIPPVQTVTTVSTVPLEADPKVFKYRSSFTAIYSVESNFRKRKRHPIALRKALMTFSTVKDEI